MSEIFISYASKDHALAKDIAEALEEQGWSVWWDRNIPPGKTFDEVITEALNIAKCVVVLWSGKSTSSNWVKEEASEGARRNILVPVLIEDVTIPLGFKRIQAANLIGWKKGTKNDNVRQFLEAVAQTLGADSNMHSSKVINNSNNASAGSPLEYHEKKEVSDSGVPMRVVASLVMIIGFFVAGWIVHSLIAANMRTSLGDGVGLFGGVPIWLTGLWFIYRLWNKKGT